MNTLQMMHAVCPFALAAALVSTPTAAIAKPSRPAPPAAPAAQAPADPSNLNILTGQATLFRAPDAFARVAVSNPKVAGVRVLSNRQVLLQGLGPGNATLMVWLKNGEVLTYRLTVGPDVLAVQKQVRDVTGNQQLRVSHNGQSFLLSGDVSSNAIKDVAGQVVGAFGDPVINLVQVPMVADQVAITVQVIELARSAALRLGYVVGGGEVTGIEQGIRKYIFKPGEVMTGEAVTGQIKTFGQIDFLAAQIEALQQRGEAKLLATPTLVTMDGGTAKFLAGGEIPIPVQQALGTTTILWKEFGVRLEIKPRVMASGRIQLGVAPEVSSLDFANGIKQSAYTIPAIKTRRAETQVMLAPQETLMLGGLMSADDNRNWQGLPGISDLPVIGELFKSRRFQENQTELAILVTPRLVKSEAEQPLPGRLPDTRRELQNRLEKRP